jgi:hypothetical protein
MSDTTNPRDATSLAHTSSPGVVDPATIARGHEIDTYDKKSVLSVPLLVVLFFVLAFGTVTIVFNYVSKSIVEPFANPEAVKDNSAPLNERLGRIESASDGTSEKPTNRSSGEPGSQPRLEPLRLRKGDARGMTQPETETGNPPELHPEDIRVSQKNTPELYESGPVGNDKSARRIPIDEAMKLALKNDFPVQKDVEETKAPKSAHIPTESNAGRGASESVAEPPKLPKPAGGKK